MRGLIIGCSGQLLGDIKSCLQVRYTRFTLTSIGNSQKVIETVEGGSPDLAMIHSSLSRIDTLDLISKIREISDVPLFVVGKGETDVDIATYLKVGADDYVAEPLDAREFLARVGAVLRRARGLVFAPQHTAPLLNSPQVTTR